MKVYELYDPALDTAISYHATIEGAVNAMAEKIKELAKPLQYDFKDDKKVDFSLCFKVISHEVKV